VLRRDSKGKPLRGLKQSICIAALAGVFVTGNQTFRVGSDTIIYSDILMIIEGIGKNNLPQGASGYFIRCLLFI